MRDAVVNGLEAPRMSHTLGSSANRRSFLKWTLATGSALAALPLLEACSSRSSQQAAAPPAAATSAPPAGAAPAATSAAAPAAAGAAPTAGPTAATRTGLTSTEWNPETIKAQAGTLKVDTAAEVGKVVPLNYTGQASFWYVGPNQATPQIEIDNDAKFWEAWKQTYPNIPMTMGENVQNLDYNQMLDKLRTAAAGNAAPDIGRLPILWGAEFAAKGQLAEIQLEEFGFKKEDFWSGALKSVMWNGKLYGIPTNNETMAFIWNKDIFKSAGLDPEKPPATWDDVVKYSAQIKKATGKAGYGMVARVNAGNTPFRVMPVLWAYGSGALDEAEPDPTYQKVLINNDGGVAALQAHYDMYVRDKSVPTSALTNTQTENGDLFISGQIAMEIAHPSEYAAMLDKAKKATGADKDLADKVVANMAYGLMPAGPVRRAVVFGGSNIHIFNDQAAGHKVDRKAADAFIAFCCGPEWSVKAFGNWTGSNPGNLQGFKTDGMKQRLDQIKFLDVTSSMLPYGVPFPVIPEANDIMNNIVPNMVQNALTGSMSVKAAADDAAEKIKTLIAQRKL
jgi:multiple sugar transport system substrate-binding protein